jgi:formate hydrogenlyase transcriptional activator
MSFREVSFGELSPLARETIDTARTSQLAVEASPSGVLLVTSDGTIVLVNRELERQFGYVRDELVGQSVNLLLPEDDALARVIETESVIEGREIHGRRKDGSLIPVEIELTPLHEAGRVLVLASVVDITERQQVEDIHRKALENQLAFERLVAELSARFIDIHPEQIESSIQDGLRRIVESFDLDRGLFYAIEPDGVFSDITSWTGPDIPSIPRRVSAKERFPFTLERILSGDVVSFSTPAEIPDERDRESFRALGTKSAVIVSLSVAGRVAGAVGFSTVRAERTWAPPVVHRFKVIASVFAQVMSRRQSEATLRNALAEVERLKEDLQVENVHLRREVREWSGPAPIVGQSAAIRQVLEQIEQVAATDSTVLLLGETGTGKELFATQIHELGPRRDRPMVRTNCAAIPSTLIESELFGREKGAFTGALARQVGRFELASGSTIFLDEIGDLPSDVQVKLLRVLEEGTIERLGSPHPIKVNTRIIAATHRNLERRVAEGAFRSDLYYRLNVFPIRVPPLRERVDDIQMLVWRFVEEFSRTFGKHVEEITPESLSALRHYPWPGNIRELRNVVERAMITASGPRLTIAPPLLSPAAARRSPKLVDVETEHIRGVLESTGWRIRGPGGAADRLGLKPTTLETRMAKLGLKRPGTQPH